MIKSQYNVIAVMSGTSLDGIDIIYVSISFSENYSFKIHHFETINYTSKWKEILSNLITYPKEELANIDTKYSKHLALRIRDFILKYKISNIDFISSHGHTALHKPEIGVTYQIGNQQVLSNILKHKVICDFRIQDVQFGGQGAPLVPIGDELFFGEYDYCLNLGGFANVSFKNNTNRIAFDICPVNIVLNRVVRELGLEYDDKGKLAAMGTLNNKLLDELNAIKFYKQDPPKSLGLEWVEKEIFSLIDSKELPLEDVLRTFVEHIALQISKVIKVKNSSVLVTGGGAYNDFLIERLKQKSEAKIIIPDKELIEFKEALIFGLLGVLKARNEINCLSSVTGASQNHSSGKILLPNI